jgi:acyl dehydratase
MTRFESPAALLAAAGADLGAGPWVEMTQERIDLFAEATGDHQWIHVDPARAASGPFGGTIAHGFLSLSLLGAMLGDLIEVPTASMGVNYGLDRVRFTAPVLSGSRVRATAVLGEVGGDERQVQVAVDITVEIEGGTKPACVARMLARYYFEERS